MVDLRERNHRDIHMIVEWLTENDDQWTYLLDELAQDIDLELDTE